MDGFAKTMILVCVTHAIVHFCRLMKICQEAGPRYPQDSSIEQAFCEFMIVLINVSFALWGLLEIYWEYQS